MATRIRRPVPRVRSQKFGGGKAGSEFAGNAKLDLRGLDAMERAVMGPAIEKMMADLGREVVEVAEPMVPVRTGELKASSYVETHIDGAHGKMQVGYSANHAAPVEFGAQGRTPKPYLTPAWEAVMGGGQGPQKLRDGLALILGEED